MTETPRPVPPSAVPLSTGPLSTAVAPERERHRHLVDAALAREADRPHPASSDVLTLLCAAAADSGEVSPTRWTRTGVHRLLHRDLSEWCARHGCPRPPGVVAALWWWLDFLHATGRLDPASDPVAELRKPLACAGRLDQDGRPLPGAGPRQVECECFLPYREGARLTGALARAAVGRGEDPLDPLRRALHRRTWSPPAAAAPPPGPGWSASGP